MDSAAQPTDPAQPADKATPRWVWCSTPETAEARVVSVLALVETVLATVVFGWILLRNGTLHLTISACIAPLLLLRTERSTALALSWFFAQRKLWTRILHATDWVAKLSPDPARWRYLVALPIHLFGAMFVAFGSLALLSCYAFALRLSATITTVAISPLQTAYVVPRNWWRAIVSVDTLHPSEPIPGSYLVRSPPLDSDSRSILRPLQSISEDFKNRSTDAEQAILYPIVALVYLPLIAPTVAYRWSLKGSCLIYLPFVWIAHSSFTGTVLWRIREIRNLLLSKFVLVYSILVGAFLASKLVLSPMWNKLGEKLASTEYGAAITAYLGIGPIVFPMWQFASLINAVLAWALFFYADKILLRHKHGDPIDETTVDYTVKTLSIVRGVLTIYTVTVLVYVAASHVEKWGLPKIGTRLFPW